VSGSAGCYCRSSAVPELSCPRPPRILERFRESDDSAKSSQVAMEIL
jgi:hypothetical protein